MRLILPSTKYKDAYLKALEEVVGENGETRLNAPEPGQTFEAFVQMWHDYGQGKNLPDGIVPSTMYWMIEHDEIIGRIHLRHELNEFLFNYGGHIGYYVKPSKRRMGYGTTALQLVLIKANKLSLSKILVTCDDNNIGSRTIIESCGGVLENIVEQPEGKPNKRRYWITV